MRMYLLVLLASMLAMGCSPKTVNFYSPDGESLYLPYDLDGIPFMVADRAWEADMLGNHRVVVTVADVGESKGVLVNLPWRRPDLRPETKKVVVVDARTGEKIKNVLIKKLNAEKGTLIFEPVGGPGDYYIYYLPYKFRKGWNDARYGEPWNDYLPPIYES